MIKNFNILLIQRNSDFNNTIEENENIIIFNYEDYFNKNEHSYKVLSEILSNFKVKTINNFYNKTTQKILDEVNNHKKESKGVKHLVKKILNEIDPNEKL